MAKQVVAIGDNGLELVNKLGNNFDELYAGSSSLYYILYASGADDTAALQAIINLAKLDAKKILLSGDFLITDEIVIDQSVWIEGVGTYNAETGRNNPRIVFTNTSVDGVGNATKCCIRITAPSVNYKQIRCTIKNLEFHATNDVALHQHGFIFSGYAMLTNCIFDNLVFKYFSGYCFFLNGAADLYPYGHLTEFLSIGSEWVGGVIGCEGTFTPYFAANKLDNVYLEAGLNAVSCEDICFNLLGWRGTFIRNVIVEGNFNSLPATATMFYLSNSTYLDLIWEEGLPNGYYYLLDVIGGIINLNRYLLEIGGAGKRKIRASGALTQIVIANTYLAGNLEFSDIFTISNGAGVRLDNIHRWGSQSSGAIAKYPLIKDTEIGTFQVENVICQYGLTEAACISQKKYIEIYRKGADYFRSNDLVEFLTIPTIINHATDRQELVLDADEGVVSQWITASDTFPYSIPPNNGSVRIVAPQYIGSTLIVAIRYKYVTANGALIVNLLSTAYNPGAELNMTFGNSVLNEWAEQYVVIMNYAGDVLLSTVVYNELGKTDIYISELVVAFGKDLPQLQSKKNITNISISAMEMPPYGTFKIGDFVRNLNPVVTGAGGSQYIIDGWRRITTGSANVLNTDWVEMRVYTGT